VRLWSFHPECLDSAGLVACWREALLAQAVLAGKTKGYRHHPQLERFRGSADPAASIGRYLSILLAEASRRGYAFDATKIGIAGDSVSRIAVSRGQVEYEWALFRKKAAARDRAAFARIESVVFPRPHPLFRLVEGGIADWERPKDLGSM
jgi:hypothetical protein